MVCVQKFILLFLLFVSFNATGQDVDFHLNTPLLAGKIILKIKRDFNDPYLWVLAKDNEVYRVNTSTRVVDDYTSNFSAYKNLEFIDIAGRSQDTVFIATKSTTLVEYRKGTVKTIGIADGLLDNITSIGMANGLGIFDSHYLLVGTEGGLGRYDYTSEQFFYFKYYVPYSVKIYEATYRSLMLTDNHQDNPDYYPVVFSTPYASYGYNIRHTTLSGKKINTAFYTANDLLESTIFNGSLFWGSENGLFQESMGTDNNFPNTFFHFLNGIKVNKITNIIGLASLFKAYTPTGAVTKENLLVGTDKGLYYSTTLFGPLQDNVSAISVFHYDSLGNVPVNDVCVSGSARTLYSTPAGCEDGVWLATNNGLYNLTPDYGKYIDAKLKAKAIYFDVTTSDTLTHATVCAGSSIPILVNYDSANNNIIRWVKDGVELPDENKRQLDARESGEYHAVLYAPCENIHIETNRLWVKVVAGPVFSFNYPDKIQQCDNVPLTLKVDNNANYQYRWYTDGVLNGETTASLTATKSGKYKVEVSLCPNSWVAGKEVEVNMIDLPVPAITPGKAIYCSGDIASLSSNVLTDAAYSLNWYRNGALLAEYTNQPTIKTNIEGAYILMVSSKVSACAKSSAPQSVTFTPSPVFTFNYPDELKFCDGTTTILKADGSATYQYRWYKDEVLTGDTGPSLNVKQTGSYKVEVSACEGSWVPAKKVQVSFISLPVPAISTNKPVYCLGDIAILSTNIPVSSNYTINWYRDNSRLPGFQDQTSITTDIAGAYSVSLTTIQPICSQSSVVQPVVFNPQPTVSIRKSIKTTLCDGQPVELKVDYTGGNVKWSTGESGSIVTINHSGTYRANVTSAAGCVADANIDVQFFQKPLLHLKDTSICVFDRESITLTAPADFKAYSWNNGLSAAQAYTVNAAQTITLTVTDMNGCQATQLVVIGSHCPEVHMANTFTPNGDGVNDTWAISGLENDPTLLVSVYNRYGNLVFQSRGYATPWNGQYQGKKLPPGTYYYMITAKGGKQTLSGSVTIIY